MYLCNFSVEMYGLFWYHVCDVTARFDAANLIMYSLVLDQTGPGIIDFTINCLTKL